MASHIRPNGARDITAREYKVFERLVKGGHRDWAIAEMLGRTERGVRGLREYYGMTRPLAYRETGYTYPEKEREVIKEKIENWVEVERLSPQQMADRLKLQHPPGLHRATVIKWIRRLGPHTWKTHKENMSGRRSRAVTLRHLRGRLQKEKTGQAITGSSSQVRKPNGAFAKKDEVQNGKAN